MEIVFSERTLTLERTGVGTVFPPVTLDIDTGRAVKPHSAAPPSAAASVEPCHDIDPTRQGGKTVCPFPAGVLTVEPTAAGSLLEWRSATGSWRAVARGLSHNWVIWAASGRLFIGSPQSDVSTLECFDHQRGHPLWMYAYSSASNRFQWFAETARQGLVGTIALKDAPDSVAPAPYPGTLILETVSPQSEGFMSCRSRRAGGRI